MPTGVYKRTERNKNAKGKRWKHSEETKKRMSESRKRLKLYFEKCYAWKGDEAGQHSKHRWVEKIKGKPNKCEHCGSENKSVYHWANVDHKYRRVIEDYMRLCSKCHFKYDFEKGLRTKINNKKKHE